MLYNFLVPLADAFGPFNLFRYLTFRTGGAVLTALFLSLLLGPVVIRWLRGKQGDGQPIRSDGPESHLLTKKGTPTMGGVLILMVMVISTVLWADLTNGHIWSVLVLTLGFGAIGFWDDYTKLTRRNSRGMSGRIKLMCQVLIALTATAWILHLSDPELTFKLSLPFVKDLLLDLGYFYIAFAILVMVGASNAVNLTDGLDGLAIVPVMIVCACFAVIAYLVGRIDYATYLQINHVPRTGELAVFCGALIGAGLGFLWYNAPPASVFMGDTGSLALGGALGGIAVITKHELVLAIAGGLFVAETASVMIQVMSFKLTGKRVFLMAPLHHHFEKKGWAEPTIVIRFWIVSLVLALLALSTLKLR